MIKLYGFGPTRYLRAKWALEEAELKYEFIDARELMKTGEYTKIHPQGKVPALEIDGNILFESVAIVNYVGAKVPDKNFIPKEGTFERAYYDQWSCFALAELETWVWHNAKHSFLNPEEKRVAKVLDLNSEEYIKSATVVENHLANNVYILGDNFSFADINIGYVLNWGRGFGLTGDLPKVNAYLDKLSERPHSVLQEHTEIMKSMLKDM